MVLGKVVFNVGHGFLLFSRVLLKFNPFFEQVLVLRARIPPDAKEIGAGLSRPNMGLPMFGPLGKWSG